MVRWMWIATLGFCGCTIPVFMDPSYVTEGGRRGAIREAADTFGHDLRWGRIDQATARITSDRRDEFRVIARSLVDRVRLTEFEVESVDLGTMEDEATVHVRYTLYRIPAIQETRVREAQTWRFDRIRRGWFLDPDLELYAADLDSRLIDALGAHEPGTPIAPRGFDLQ